MTFRKMRASIASSALALATITGAAVLVGSAPEPKFTEHNKAYYANSELVAFVRPGLQVKMLSAEVASDRSVKTRIKLTDPKGLPLDLNGVDTPGAIRVLMVIGYIPADGDQYVPYNTRTSTSSITGVTAVQPYYDMNGKFVKVADGTYDYTFATKLPESYDRNATHTIALRATRDLSEFSLGSNYANETINFVPAGGTVKKIRDVVRTETCNQCHNPLQMHGGNRAVSMCVVCHTKGMTDPDTGESIDFAIMIHRIHRGHDLPSVKAGRPYKIIGSRPDQVYDFSKVSFPRDVRNCETCHQAPATQTEAWLKPNRSACGSCHDDVKFETGEGHVNLPQFSDNQCGQCHVREGELEFDASIKGGHTTERFSKSMRGVLFEILKVDDGIAGKRPTVTFSLRDKEGNPILPSAMDSVSLVLTGPTTEYTGRYVSEDARKAEGTGGVYYWTFQNPIPADAKGSYAIGIGGYRNIKLLEGTRKERTEREAGVNKVAYFSVDGSAVQPRREVVSLDKCNECHFSLAMHGNGRNRVEHCAQCHNLSLTDAAGSAAAGVKPGPLLFRYMIHRIHTGHDSKNPFIIYGAYGGNLRRYDFGEVRYPGDRRDCGKCHVNNSEQLPLADGMPGVSNPRGPLDPMGPAAAACLGCHTSADAASHARAMTNEIGESCAVCHGRTGDFSVNRAHAR
jgi:OmcA/MtrC family decaheme c-type cytochrome